jgi:hypothetical protein
MLLMINCIKKEKNLSKNFLRKIKYYELQSLINLNKKNKVSELINEEINKYGNIDSDANNDFDCFNFDDFPKDVLLSRMAEIQEHCEAKGLTPKFIIL